MSKFVRALPLFTLINRPLSFCCSSHHLTFPKSKPEAVLHTALCNLCVSSATPNSSTESLISDHKKPQLSSNDSLRWVRRTAFCGELSEADVGNWVRLCGWVALHRDHGGLTFLNLRDHTGIVQATTLPDKYPDAHRLANEFRLEYVIAVEGVVRLRPGESVNKTMKTGMIEYQRRSTEGGDIKDT